MEKNSSSKLGSYRVEPRLRNAFLVALVYVIYFTIALKISGVGYENITDSPDNVLKAVVLPMVGGAIGLTIFAKWSGWWKDLWHDKYKIQGHRWMHLFAAIMTLSILGNLASAKLGSSAGQMISYIFIGTALVGYSEELLFRGVVLRGARGSGLSELRVMLVVALSFGVFHGANLLVGQDLPTTMQQVAFATINGAIFYLIFRKSGLLIVPVILHGLFDFSVFIREANLGSNPDVADAFKAMSAISLYLPIILLLVSLRYVNVRDGKKVAVTTK